MKASSLSFRTAVVFAIVGICMGIGMAMSQNHSISPAHAHLNLLGWVSLFLIGVFYRLHPALDASRLAFVQVCLWIAGTVVLTVGVTALYAGYPSADPIAAIGSLIILAGVLLFAFLVFRPEPKGSRSAGLAPAE
jgi:peptidoglycan/LPS O-acetylase OafA/YrhL